MKNIKSEKNESYAVQIVDTLFNEALKGTMNLSSPDNLAKDYILDNPDKSKDEIVDSLIKWESSKSFGVGFVTGLGGFITLPVSLPASLTGNFVIQIRLSATIAKIYGHDLESENVRAFIKLTALGGDGVEIAKRYGIQIGTKITEDFISKIPEEIIKEINKQIGLKLMSKSGRLSIANISKIVVPVVGGLISGSIDGISCYFVAHKAKAAFAY
jgi:uncharacterized protein (DUF697 family)